MHRIFLAATLAVALGGCANGRDGQPSTSPLASADAQGRDLARHRCAACHATDLSDASPRQNAPAFRRLRIRFNQISWERAMAEIARGGHDEMPPLTLTQDEIRHLKAYIDSLSPP